MAEGPQSSLRPVVVGVLLTAAVVGGLWLLLPRIGREVRTPEERADLLPRAADRSAVEGRQAPPRPEAEVPTVPPEDLASMVPTDGGLREIVAEEFRLNGGVRSPGTDPAAARREVGLDGWSERTSAGLRQGLEKTIAFGGARLDRAECRRGRCLVELSYDSMTTAISRFEPIRQWMTDEVSCPAYTEGPDEGESPSVRPSQQIWILCGEPPAKRSR